MFASRTLIEHVLRGAVGIGALWLAATIGASHPWSSLALGAVVLLAFRCWTIGLFETVARQTRKPSGSRRI